MLYSIADWDLNFEIQQSRRNAGRLNWVAIPTRHDGKGFRRLSRLPDGPAIYCAWTLIVQVAAKCPTRGVLADEDGPLTAEDLADKTGFPEEIFEKAFNALCDKRIGWLVRESVAEQSHNDTTAVLAQYEYVQTNVQTVQTDVQTNKQTNKHDRTNERTNEETADDHEDSLLKAAEAVEAAVLKRIPCHGKDRAFIRKASLAVASGAIPEHWVIDSANGSKETKPRNHIAYFTSLLKTRCEQGHYEFKNITRLKVPANWGTGPPERIVKINHPPEVTPKTTGQLLKELEAAAQK